MESKADPGSSQAGSAAPGSESGVETGGPPPAAPPPEHAERARELLDQLDRDFAEAWIPENPGDKVVGVFKRLDRANTTRGPRHVVIMAGIKNPDHEFAIWLHHTALRSQFRKASPSPGEMVAVRYEGKKISGSTGQEYDDWRVAVDRPETATVDWSELPLDDDSAGETGGPSSPRDEPMPDAPPAESASFEQAVAPREEDLDIPFAPTSGPHGY